MGICRWVTAGWIHSIYFYLHSFLRSTAEFLRNHTKKKKKKKKKKKTTKKKKKKKKKKKRSDSDSSCWQMSHHSKTGGAVDTVNTVKLPWTLLPYSLRIYIYYISIFSVYFEYLFKCGHLLLYRQRIAVAKRGGGGAGVQTIYWNDVFTFLRVMYLA